VKVDRPGVYFGQCDQLCGARHGYMPIAIDVVPPAQFAAWIASKGGTMPGAAPAAAPAGTSPAATPAVATTATPAEAKPTPAPAATPAVKQP
jgi:cytochrome c oxidase subunit 2